MLVKGSFHSHDLQYRDDHVEMPSLKVMMRNSIPVPKLGTSSALLFLYGTTYYKCFTLVRNPNGIMEQVLVTYVWLRWKHWYHIYVRNNFNPHVTLYNSFYLLLIQMASGEKSLHQMWRQASNILPSVISCGKCLYTHVASC